MLNSKTKGQLARESKREAQTVLAKDIPYHLVPSRKDKDKYFSHLIFSGKSKSPSSLVKRYNRCRCMKNSQRKKKEVS